jgi:hypothetical protein
MERTLDLHYDKIVIGADLSALSFSYTQKIPLIFNRYLKPYQYGFDNDYEKKLNKYNELLYKLAFNGMCPLTNKIQSIRIEEDIIRITTNTNCLIKIKYNNLIISDDFKVEGLPNIIGKTNTDNCVIDHLGVDERAKLDPVINRNDNIIKTIYFPNKYVSRVRAKQLIINSIISDEDLKKIEFSESYMRLRLRRIFEPEIISFNHFTREVHSLGKNLYDLPENISILTEDYEKILSGEQKYDRYFSFIERKIWNK